MVADFTPASNYDRVHRVTGHPGKSGMQWHRKNSINGAYSKQDARPYATHAHKAPCARQLRTLIVRIETSPSY